MGLLPPGMHRGSILFRRGLRATTRRATLLGSSQNDIQTGTSLLKVTLKKAKRMAST